MIRVGIDVGGTFTDIVMLAPGGEVRVAKVRSGAGAVPDEVWRRTEESAAGASARRQLIHGTTVATNALLERRGARVVLVTTAGFEDLLWLRRQDRAALYDLAADHPPPPVAREDVVGVHERMGPDGVVQALEERELRRVVEEVRRRGPEAVAVSLLFSFRDPEHERRIGQALRGALPDLPVAVSSEVLPVFREYERTSTTAAEAYLQPLVQGYVRSMAEDARGRGFAAFDVMASNGGTLSAEQAGTRATALALSGPAGGVEGARLLGTELGIGELLTLDMGGTSADASLVRDGRPLTERHGSVGGVPLALPHVLIETVGAGGGSVAWVDQGGALRVGPRSAGARPGPACYGLGGEEATVTDAAVVLGWLGRDHPLAGELVLDPDLAREAVDAVARAADVPRDRCAEGIIEIATATMVRALRRVSVERGIDPRRMALVAFGGAGPLFACRMADSLGMTRAVIPPHPGVFSALGLAAAPAKIERTASVHRGAVPSEGRELERVFADLASAVARDLPGAALQRVADCRYPGQGYEVAVPAPPALEGLPEAFHAAHRERYGHADPARAVEVVNARVVATKPGPPVILRRGAGGADGALEDLAPGTEVRGPATLSGRDATARIEAGWTARVHPTGALIVERR